MNKLIIGNWKMNGSLELINNFIEKLDQRVIIAVPSVFMAYAHFKNPDLQLAAQDCSVFSSFGAHTGEVSAQMLNESGCKYVIIGHSERRQSSIFDSVENVLKKLENVALANMTAILCVDENYDTLLDEQTVNFLKSHTANVILAYEPLSAIGTGHVPAISEISNILKSLKNKYFGIKTLYGGSVNSKNAKDILSDEAIDGVLVGGASLKIDEINEIAKF